MLILNEQYRPVDRVASFIWLRVDRERTTTLWRLGGRLVAYLPQTRRAYYTWALVISYTPAQHLSAYQFVPPQVRLILGARWELGLVLGYWTLGLRLGQPLAWIKRLQTV
jgi:hypothetical protein